MKWILATALVGVLGAAGLVWADDHDSKPADRTDKHDMMQGGMRSGMMSMTMHSMRGNGAGMMDECAGMMRDNGAATKRPNEQWRKER